MRDRTGPIHDRSALLHRASPLCRAARLLALGYGLLIALYVLAVFMMVIAGHVSRGEEWGSVIWLLSGLPFFLPLLLAVLAWRWHLLGGALITAGTMALYLILALAGDVQWGVHLYLLPLLAGGVMHLLAWHAERKSGALAHQG